MQAVRVYAERKMPVVDGFFCHGIYTQQPPRFPAEGAVSKRNGGAGRQLPITPPVSPLEAQTRGPANRSSAKPCPEPITPPHGLLLLLNTPPANFIQSEGLKVVQSPNR